MRLYQVDGRHWVLADADGYPVAQGTRELCETTQKRLPPSYRVPRSRPPPPCFICNTVSVGYDPLTGDCPMCDLTFVAKVGRRAV